MCLANDLLVCFGVLFVTWVGRCRILVFTVLHYRVSDDCQNQKSQQDVQFVLQAYKRAVGEGDDKTKRLPHPVVGERCLFVPGE